MFAPPIPPCMTASRGPVAFATQRANRPVLQVKHGLRSALSARVGAVAFWLQAKRQAKPTQVTRSNRESDPMEFFMRTTKSLLIAAALATAATFSFAQAAAPAAAPAAPMAAAAPTAAAPVKAAKTMKKSSKKHVAKTSRAKAAKPA